MQRWLRAMALAVLSVVLVGTVWVVPYLPTNDGPEWIFATHAENHFADPDAPYRDNLIPTPQFASRGMSLVYAPFEDWLGWRRGLQVTLSLILLGTAWCFYALVCALDGERWPIGLLGFPLALTWEFYEGLWPFVISSGVGLGVLALAVRLKEPSWRERAVLAFMLFVQAICHVFGAVLTGGALLLLAMARAPRGRRLRELVGVALTGLPAAGVLAACVAVSRTAADAPLAHDFESVRFWDGVAMFPRTVVPGPLWRALIVTALVLVGTVVAVVRARQKTATPADRGLGIAAVVLMLAGAFAPLNVPGWQLFSQRFVPLGVALVFAVLPLERGPNVVRRLAPGGLFACALVWLGFSYPFHRRLTELCPDAIRGLDIPFRTHGELLTFVFRPTEEPVYDYIRSEVPFQNPLLHMGVLYSVVLGSLPASSFTGGYAVHAFSRRPNGRPLPNPEHFVKEFQSHAFSHDLAARNAVEDDLPAFGAFYDEVAIFGAIPSDLALWRHRGFVTDWTGKSTFLAHFEPCHIDVTVPPALVNPLPSFDVREGKMTLLTNAQVAPVLGEDGLAHFVLAPAPCGEVGITARWPGAAGVASGCRNVNAAGEIVADITRENFTVACEAY